ncbi:MAG TPA: hypothetical protein VME44_04640 [Streptosporangiaceae bacterium]|nr:hypothetical protein [Streptosporangiaceae bacterium]
MSDVEIPPSESVPDAVTVMAPGMIVPGTAAPVAGPVVPAPLTAIQLALYAGWTMAVLYGNLQEQPADLPELRTVNELQPQQRRDLELARLQHLLEQLSAVPAIRPADLSAKIPADAGDHDALTVLHLDVLEALTASPPDTLLAYQLGRSLRDTVNPPLMQSPGAQQSAPAVARQFRRDRIATLQEWLAALASQLPQHAATVVSTSLGRWSEFAAVTVGAGSELRSDDRATVEAAMLTYLLPQGDAWLMLLTGARPCAGLLTPEAYVAAGEEALSRSAATARHVLEHYWLWVLVGAAALGGVLYLIFSNLAGAGEVWTSIAAIGGSLGISANTIASSARRLAAEAERPVFAMAEEDAMAWAVTTMPKVDLSRRGVRKLRKAGIAPPGNLGRI